MAYRPQNTCPRCGYTWHPRGHNVSLRCPNCGCRDVKVVTIPCGMLLAASGGLVLIGFFAVCCLGLFGVGGGQQRARDDGPGVADNTDHRPRQEQTGDPDVPPRPEPKDPAGTPTLTDQPVPPAQPRPQRVPSSPPPLPEAPSPRTVHPLPPPVGGWSSDWQRIGAVQVRIRAVGVARARLIDSAGRRSDSPHPQLVIWLELQNMSPDRPREYRRWQPVTDGECTLYLPTDSPVGVPRFPGDSRVELPGEFKQALEPGGPPVPEVVVFEVPPDWPEKLTLRLDARRVEERFAYRFEIPRSAWKR